VQTSKSGNTVYIQICVWYNEKTRHIHLTAPETKWLHTTVNNEPGSKRYHPNMFAKLGRLLLESGAPAPEYTKVEAGSD
jgi:hypothetical protein